jgi:hypothetical protein
MVWEPASRTAGGRARPPSRRRVDHEVRVSACRPGRGSRRRASTRSPSWHSTKVAFGSHPNGRSPIAYGSPFDRQSGRSLGERMAVQPRRRPGVVPPRRKLIARFSPRIDACWPLNTAESPLSRIERDSFSWTVPTITLLRPTGAFGAASAPRGSRSRAGSISGAYPVSPKRAPQASPGRQGRSSPLPRPTSLVDQRQGVPENDSDQ